MDENIHDPLTMEQTQMVSEIFDHASKILENGGKVIVQRVFTNAPPNQLCVFDKLEDLTGWKERLNDVQVILDRDTIS